jgi:hypothetical protein
VRTWAIITLEGGCSDGDDVSGGLDGRKGPPI